MHDIIPIQYCETNKTVVLYSGVKLTPSHQIGCPREKKKEQLSYHNKKFKIKFH